ncbi:hypothetical protein [Caulobacter sp. UC70_42]|uniref:hypothetical protein n=1 Tax=Caulobacter sp. UC70_42 TaxID=3374551 RepID=UPI003757479D
MTLPKKIKPPVEEISDRLTFSAWPPKVDGIGKAAVDRAFIIALAVVVLLALMVVVGALKAPASTNPFAALGAFLSDRAR